MDEDTKNQPDFNRVRVLKQKKRPLTVHVVLFLLTVASTTLVQGPYYSVALITILLFHEMGHYFAARYYRVPATLPYFIPMPSLFGTMGAVIRMGGVIPNRKALFDIGLMGPLAGVVIAIPATIVGLYLSEVQITDGGNPQGMLMLGESLLFSALSWLVHGPLPENANVVLHPIGFAGWAGLFVTALNLLPVGQLDGGHAIYAMFPRHSRMITRAMIALFVALAALTNPGWIVFILLLFFLGGLKHPPTFNDDVEIGPTRFKLGIVALVFFVLTFPPVPLKISGENESKKQEQQHQQPVEPGFDDSLGI